MNKKEVSCAALGFFCEYLETHGHQTSQLLAGLDYDTKYLTNKTNWIDYKTFLEIENRLQQLFPVHEELFFQVGLSLSNVTKSLRFMRLLSRVVVSPFHIYQRLPSMVPKYLFPFVKISITRTSKYSVAALYEFDQNYPPSEPFLETVRGILVALPQVIGAPQSKVNMKRLTSHKAKYYIKVTQGWLGPVDFIQRSVAACLSLYRNYFRNIHDAVRELEETNRLLQNQVDELNSARKELKQTEAQLAQAAKLASLGTLASGIAHELNNPLTAIIGYADLLASDPEEPHRSWAETILACGSRMKAIIDHLRVFAREGKSSDWRPISINEVIRRSLDFMEHQLKLMNIEVVLNLHPSNPVVVGDPNGLESVIQNFVTNSRDAFAEHKNAGLFTEKQIANHDAVGERAGDNRLF